MRCDEGGRCGQRRRIGTEVWSRPVPTWRLRAIGLHKECLS